jgi:hypothetical protein
MPWDGFPSVLTQPISRIPLYFTFVCRAKAAPSHIKGWMSEALRLLKRCEWNRTLMIERSCQDVVHFFWPVEHSNVVNPIATQPFGDSLCTTHVMVILGMVSGISFTTFWASVHWSARSRHGSKYDLIYLILCRWLFVQFCQITKLPCIVTLYMRGVLPQQKRRMHLFEPCQPCPKLLCHPLCGSFGARMG